MSTKGHEAPWWAIGTYKQLGLVNFQEALLGPIELRIWRSVNFAVDGFFPSTWKDNIYYSPQQSIYFRERERGRERCSYAAIRFLMGHPYAKGLGAPRVPVTLFDKQILYVIVYIVSSSHWISISVHMAYYFQHILSCNCKCRLHLQSHIEMPTICCPGYICLELN